jgi:hypothetical protein
MNNSEINFDLCLAKGIYSNNFLKHYGNKNAYIICDRCHQKQMHEIMEYEDIKLCLGCFNELHIQKHNKQQEKYKDVLLSDKQIKEIKNSYYDPLATNNQNTECMKSKFDIDFNSDVSNSDINMYNLTPKIKNIKLTCCCNLL